MDPDSVPTNTWPELLFSASYSCECCFRSHVQTIVIIFHTFWFDDNCVVFMHACPQNAGTRPRVDHQLLRAVLFHLFLVEGDE